MDSYSKNTQFAPHWDIWSYNYFDSPGGGKRSFTFPSAGAWLSKQSTFSGERNPLWRDQVRSGNNATTPASGTLYYGSPGQCSYAVDHLDIPVGGTKLEVFRGHARWQLSAWQFSDTIAVPGTTVTRVTNRVISRFLSQAKELTTSFESGQDLGEYKETLRTIRKPLASMHDHLESYFARLTKIKRKKKPGSLPKALADTYLEFRFGINPLVLDVTDAVTKCGSHRWPTAHLKSSSKELYSSTVGSQLCTISGDYLNSYQPNIMYKDDSIYSVRYRGAVRTHADPDGKSSIVRELQLLPQDWLPTAWDLLPYSWIADYFTNIGEIIQALSFITSDLVWAEKSIQTKRDRLYTSFSFLNLKEFSSYKTVSLVGSGKLDSHPRQGIVKFQRSKLLESDLMPRFEFRIPTGKYPYLNMGALLLSRASHLVPFF